MHQNSDEHDPWKDRATIIMKILLVKAGNLKHKDLQQKLAEIGIEKHSKTITSTINKGGFSLAFFLQCLAALNIKQVDFSDIIEEVYLRKK